MSGIGHNSGRVIEPGAGWRRHAWTKARAQLLPKLPIEVVRLRVRRAQELGLPYKTYAGIRASTGHDLIGFLFSSNALRVFRDGQTAPKDRSAKLTALIGTNRIGIAHKQCKPSALIPPMDHAYPAPQFTDSWSDMRDQLKSMLRDHGAADRFVLVGDTAEERAWAEAAKAAGYLDADSYFPTV